MSPPMAQLMDLSKELPLRELMVQLMDSSRELQMDALQKDYTKGLQMSAPMAQQMENCRWTHYRWTTRGDCIRYAVT